MDSRLIRIVVVFGGILSVIALNLLAAGRITDVALRKFIIPDLESAGFKFLYCEPTSFFDKGDFRPKDLDPDPIFFSTMGNSKISQFIYVHYEDPNTTAKKRVTVKIDTWFWSVQKVTYSSPLTSAN